MSDYLFNVVSVTPPYGDKARARDDLVALLTGLASLDSGQEKLPSFRLPQDPWMIAVANHSDGRPISLGELATLLYDEGYRDVATFFDSLVRLMPSDANLNDAEIDAVLRLEPLVAAESYEHQFPSVAATPVESSICAVVGSLMASFSSVDLWDFDELNFASNGHHYSFDHLAKPDHVDAIQLRRLTEIRATLTRRNFWASRSIAFPHLRFGSNVETDIEHFSATLLPLLFKRLAVLDGMSRVWNQTGAFPSEPLTVAPETPATMARYGHQRSFRSFDGVMRTHELHIWIDGSHRVHIYRHDTLRVIGVGYIGKHLSTMLYPT